MITHHPQEAQLLALAAGALTPGQTVLVAGHVERCKHCLEQARQFEAIGAALVEELDPVPPSADALKRTLALIEERPTRRTGAPGYETEASELVRADLPSDAYWPRCLRGSAATRWRRVAPGVRWSRIKLPRDVDANIYLLRVAAGKKLPIHTHRGAELTLVLYGAFVDNGHRFSAGDFEDSDERVHHQPVAATDGECICLLSVEGRLAFDGRMARLLGSMLRL